ncbi:7,8-didemethyl-8-hydroxy-5-deazariboflavin synthase subunit CofG [uncultured Methanobrevibacter sp.]|uniref:7,8-didemethyl-8-hydroxy-5-deazariboflavin synthase subunit CofG n=1 Tax=uncultured Methanobrevibacter sp. TaxID=253161 RepID=UPI0025F82CD8|nr:7,8-didemethyl-8-hydroxy-5-deazariboflavin synthase subunit CofG [uncultured Methanobrevibacter sp.]
MEILNNLKSKKVSIEELSKEDLSNLLKVKSSKIIDLMNLANEKKENNNTTYSKNVFIPITEICKNDCGYCNFKKSPDDKGAIILKKLDEILNTLKESEKYGCKEALFTFGEDADEEKVVKEILEDMGYGKMVDYTYDFCKSTLINTNLLPHTNCGNMSYNDMKKLKEVNVSMGLMLETSSKRLMETIAHKKSPGKLPKRRIKTITNAGKLKIPYTTGILIGIGEKKEEIVDSLLTIKKIHEKYGHIQEIIIQNFTPTSGIEMENYPSPSLMDMVKTVSLAKLLFDNVSIQVPPNLNYDTAQIFLLCGCDDWGGVSPLTNDYVNSTSPWPTLDYLNELTLDCGNLLKERLAVYEKYINNDYLSPLTYDKSLKLQNEINKS